MEKIKDYIDSLSKYSISKEDKDEIIASIKSDPDLSMVYDRGITDELIEKYYDKIYDFLLDYHYCKNCPGLDNCEKENPYIVCNIVLKNGYVDRKLSNCKRTLESFNNKNRFLIRDFPEEWLNNSIRNIDKAGRASLLKRYIDIKENGGWLYIYGALKTGRSFVSSILANDYGMKNNSKIYYLDFPTRINELSSKKFNQQTMIEKIKNIDVLVLDNFGDEYISSYIRDMIIMPILKYRSTNNLFTIFVSDFSISEIENNYKAVVGYNKAKQLSSLIKNMCKEEINLGENSIY
ncbi:MAG: hypothetical protein ACI31G_01055 [Bacilli bacterium]